MVARWRPREGATKQIETPFLPELAAAIRQEPGNLHFTALRGRTTRTNFCSMNVYASGMRRSVSINRPSTSRNLCSNVGRAVAGRARTACLFHRRRHLKLSWLAAPNQLAPKQMSAFEGKADMLSTANAVFEWCCYQTVRAGLSCRSPGPCFGSASARSLTATASISTIRSGWDRRRTSTVVLAGRPTPK